MKQKKWRKLVDLIKYLMIIGLVFGLSLLILSLIVYQITDKPEREFEKADPVPALNQQIWEYKPLVEKYAKQHGIEEQTNTILAMMMQESGGRGTDPMQSSESLCGEIGCIDDPEHSIEQGVSFFAWIYEQAEGDEELAVQAYNFGLVLLGMFEKWRRTIRRKRQLPIRKTCMKRQEERVPFILAGEKKRKN